MTLLISLTLALAPFILQETRPKAEAKSEVNVRLIEFFDEDREHPHYAQEKPVEVKTSTGRVSWSSECFWEKRQEEPFVPRFQEEDELPVPGVRRISGSPLRSAAVAASFEPSTDYSISSFDALSPSTGDVATFDEVETGLVAGVSIEAVFEPWKDFELGILVDYVAGEFKAGESRSIPAFWDPHLSPEPPPDITDTFDLSGELWMLRIGIAPRIAGFATEDRVISVSLSPVIQFYTGALADIEVKRSGGAEETIELSDEDLTGGSVGAAVRGDVRISGAVRFAISVRAQRNFGDLEGWNSSGSVGISVDF